MGRTEPSADSPERMEGAGGNDSFPENFVLKSKHGQAVAWAMQYWQKQLKQQLKQREWERWWRERQRERAACCWHA